MSDRRRGWTNVAFLALVWTNGVTLLQVGRKLSQTVALTLQITFVVSTKFVPIHLFFADNFFIKTSFKVLEYYYSGCNK
jgi:hypothetical protein